MKSIRNEAPAHCPNACEPFDVEYWSFVRADEDPDLKDAVLGGELNLVRCPECGSYFHYDGDLIYFDAQSELLVFVFSEATKQKAPDLQKRIQEDYNIIKNTLFKELSMDYPPISVFGLEELKELIHQTEHATAESEVVAAACAAAGFGVCRLHPAYARKHHFPYYVPAPTNPADASSYAVAAAKVLKSGVSSPLLLQFKDDMSQENSSVPEMI